jgi:hypothetical protein
MNDSCSDNRFEIIEKAKKYIIEATNISTSPDEMKVLDSFLYRCWQLGWLDRFIPRDNGIYTEFFAVNDGMRYNAKVVNMKDFSKTLTDSLLEGIEKTIGIKKD